MTINNLSEVQRSWLAAVIDCEGTARLYIDKKEKRRGPKRWVYTRVRPTIMISNTDRRLIDRVSNVVGAGNLHLYENQPDSHFGRRPVFRWSLDKREDMELLLPQILDYLVLKKEHVKAILQFFALRGKWKQFTPETFQKSVELSHNIFNLNQIYGKGGKRSKKLLEQVMGQQARRQ